MNLSGEDELVRIPEEETHVLQVVERLTCLLQPAVLALLGLPSLAQQGAAKLIALALKIQVSLRVRLLFTRLYANLWHRLHGLLEARML